VTDYAREVLGSAAGGALLAAVRILPYGFEPAPAVRQGLEALLRAAFGDGVRCAWSEPAVDGAEETLDPLAPEPAARVDHSVLLLNLAATPEAETHGRAVARFRDRCRGGDRRAAQPLRCLVLVDASALAARFGGDPGYAGRLGERAGLWQRFVAGYGLRAAVIDLAALSAAGTISRAALDELRSTWA
jgi:hypothetical protein